METKTTINDIMGKHLRNTMLNPDEKPLVPSPQICIDAQARRKERNAFEGKMRFDEY